MSIEITFSKSGQGDIVLTEHDLFEFRVEKKCFDNTFELGGVVADELYIIIDNAGGYTKQAFAGTRAAVKLDGNLIGYFNSDIPKRRGGIIELYAYGDMLKTDTAMPEWALPVTFLSAYPNLATHCGLSPTVIYNGVSDVGIIMPSFEEYLKTQSCRNILAAMSEFNGGFCWIDTDLKLNIGKFEKTVSHEYSSFDLLDFDYSDETIAFSKVKMANGSIAVEFGDDSGFTLTLNTDYLTTGLDESDLMMLVELIADYYIGMELTPMTLTLPAPDYTVKLGDRIKVHVNDDNIDVYGNVSRIEYTDNLVQTIECGGFGGTERPSYTTTKSSIATAEKKAAGGGSAGIGIRAAYGVALTASTTKQPLISIAYSATSTAYISYHATLIFNVTTAGAIKFVLEQDSKVVQEYVQSYNAGLNFCAITYALTATNGAHNAVLGVVSQGGIATFEAGKSQAHILSGDISKEIPWDGTISAAEKMPCIAFGTPSMSPLSYTAAPTISKPTPINQIITAAMPAISFGELSATILTITDSLIMQGQTANYTDYTTVVVTFKNPVYADGGVLALSAWSIYGAISGVPTAIDITAYAISADGKKITFTTANFAGYDSGVFVSYDEVGNLRNSLDNTAVTGFIVSMIKT